MKKYLALAFFVIIGAFLMQSFQCASPEYTTAKLALKERDYPKAIEYLEKELKKNPQNGEAWVFLAETKMNIKDNAGAYEAAVKAEEFIQKDIKLMYQVQALKKKLWIDSYTSTIENINKFYQTKEVSALDEAMKNVNNAILIRPEVFEFYNLKGAIYDLKGDKDNAIKYYTEYEELIKSSVAIAKDLSIFIGAERNDVVKSLGKVQFAKGERTPGGDSSLVEVYMVNGKEFYLNSTNQKSATMNVKAWRFNPPPSLPPDDRLVIFDIVKDPLVELVQYYFDKKDYEKSLYYLNEVLVLEPTNEPANNFIVTIYDAMGKKDEASKRFVELIKKNPDNASFRLGYGNLLMQMDKYDEAIIEYSKALELDPSYYDAMRNIASAYKNKAVLIQKKQKDAVDADPTKKTQMKHDEYMPFIIKSGEYFEKCRKSPKYTNDVDVLTDLVDIYYVATQTDKMKFTIKELESIESLVPKENLERYYLQMFKIYQQRTPDAEKSKYYEEQINKLK